MYFLIYGEDGFRARKTLAAMREQFSAKRDATGLNSVALRYPGADVNDAAEAVFSSPFLAEKKMVILEGFLGAPENEQKKLIDALERKPESTNIVFYEDAGPADLKKSPLLPLLAKQKFTVECAVLAGPQLLRFVLDECAARGMTMNPRAAQTLTGTVGADTWRLQQEIHKLCAYAAGMGRKEVAEGDVKLLVSEGYDDSIFAFLDACLEGRASAAMSLLEELLLAGAAELQVVSMLTKQVRTIIAVQDLMAAGERDKAAIASRLGLHPYPAGKAMVLSKKYSFDALRARYADLLDIDRQFKTGGAKPKVLLDMFAVRMAA
jgi:DNA polymerase-3 subunit delta